MRVLSPAYVTFLENKNCRKIKLIKFLREHSFLEKETILLNRNRHFSNAIKITSILNYCFTKLYT